MAQFFFGKSTLIPTFTIGCKGNFTYRRAGLGHNYDVKNESGPHIFRLLEHYRIIQVSSGNFFLKL